MSVVIFALGIKSTNGLVKSTINTANALVKANIDTSIINIVGKFGGLDFLDAAFPLDKRVKKYSLDAIDLNIANDVTLRNSLFYQEKQQFLTASYTMYHKKVLQEIDKNLTEDDLAIFVHPLAMKIYLKANPNSKVKKIIQVHGNYLEEIDNFNLLKEHFDEIDCIQTVSKYMRDDLVNILGAPEEKTMYIPNIAIPTNIVRKEEKYLKRISIVGSIQKRKNQYDAVRVLELIPDNNVILQIYGHDLDKEYTSFIKGYIERKGLSNRVLFQDVASEKEIYENSDLIILTSIHEGFGYSFMEAAMYNLPVVSYDFKYGAKEFLRDNENGCLIEHGNYKEMAKKVSEIFESKELYNQIVQDNSKFFNDEYAEEKTVKKYAEFLGDINKKFSIAKFIKNENNYSLIFSKIKRSEKIIDVVDNRWLVNGKPETKKEKFFSFQVDIEGDISGMELFYLYKKKKIPLEYKIAHTETKKSFFLQPNINKKQKRTIEFKIPFINKFSSGNVLNKFYIFANDSKGREHYIAYIDKNRNLEFIYNLKRYYPTTKGNQNIRNITAILKPQGFFMQYPSNESILSIESETGAKLEFETSYQRYYGEYIPFFKIKTGIFKKLIVNLNSGDTMSIDMGNISFENMFNKFQHIEKKYDLFSIELDGIYIWELIRVNLFETVLEAFGVLNKHFTVKKTLNKNSIKPKKSIWSIPDCEKLIFEFPRKSDKDYRTIALQKQFEDVYILEYPQDGNYSDESYDLESKTYPIERFLEHFNKFDVKINLNAYDKEKIKWLKSIFKDELGIEIEFSLFINSRIKKYKKEYSFFDKFFKEKEIQEILIPSSYWSAGIVHAAKVNDVIVSDIQYALISKNHPSFAFPENQRHYDANRIYLWSKYWNIKEVPFDKSIVSKSNYFKEKLIDFNILNKKSEEYDYVFVSQSRIGDILFKMAYETAKEFTDKIVVFSPHPDENYKEYIEYNDFINLENTIISLEDTLIDIVKSKNVIGVYSTTLFEALALDKNVYVAKINGYEVVSKEIERGYLKLIENHKYLKKDYKKKDVDYCKLFFNFSTNEI